MTINKTIELKDGGLIVFDDSFLSADLADRYFVELRDHCRWEQKTHQLASIGLGTFDSFKVSLFH